MDNFFEEDTDYSRTVTFLLGEHEVQMEMIIEHNNLIEFQLTMLTSKSIRGSLDMFLIPNDMSEEMFPLIGYDIKIQPDGHIRHVQSDEHKSYFDTPELRAQYFFDKNMRIKFQFDIDKDDE